MRKKTVIVFLIFFTLSCNYYKIQYYNARHEKTDYKTTYIKTNKFKGVVFPMEYSDLTHYHLRSYSPTLSDIDSCEIALEKGIGNFKFNYTNDLIEYKKLKKFRRQYFGYLNDKDEKIIDINFFNSSFPLFNHSSKDENGLEVWKTEYYNPMSSITYSFSIQVNLNKKKLFEFKDMFNDPSR